MATPLNVMCSICYEFYNSSDVVCSTTICGHLFHQQCLFRWLKRATTCPQCCRPCHRNRVHRVYLNFGERSASDETGYDPAMEDDIAYKWTCLSLEDAAFPGPDVEPQGGAIRMGTDHDGNPAFVARTYFEEDLVPCNYVPVRGGAYVPWGCHAHLVRQDIELLLNCECHWVADRDGHVPPDAVVTGYTDTGEPLFTGRAEHDGRTLGGKVHPSHGVLYMPYNGDEVNTHSYEVLVRVRKPVEEQQAKKEPNQEPVEPQQQQ